MSIIGKIAKEIGEEVAEGLTKKAAPKVMPAVKKPLEWGFKGRKKTDIDDLDYSELASRTNDPQIFDRNRKKLKKGAEKNKYIKEFLEGPVYRNKKGLDWPTDLTSMTNEFKALEKAGVPRELTGKMLGNKLGLNYNERWINKETTWPRSIPMYNEVLTDWRKGWLRYHNELDDTQKETFDILSNEWDGTVNELVDVAKSL